MDDDQQSRTCFVIGPIGDVGSETRKRSDQIFRHIILPASQAAGFEKVIRADQMTSSGVISSEILQMLVEADIVVADLTDGNPNVFYELAVRHLFRKPFAHLAPDGQPIPFDLSQNRAVRYDMRDWDSAERAQNELAAALAAESGKGEREVETPFTNALDTAEVKRLAREEGESLSELARVVSRLDRRIESLVGSLSTRDTPPEVVAATLAAESQSATPWQQRVRVHPSAEALRDDWQTVVNVARRIDMRAGAVLLQVTPLEVAGDTVNIGFRFRRHYQLMTDREGLQEAIRLAISEVLGREVALMVTVHEGEWL